MADALYVEAPLGMSGRPTFSEWTVTQVSRPRTPESEFHRNATIAVARKAETVVHHEGWQTFLDHLGALRDQARGLQTAHERHLAHDDLSGQELHECRRQIARHSGAADAYEWAMKLIPTLVENGFAAKDTPPDASAS
jgi:hypothetical protein